MPIRRSLGLLALCLCAMAQDTGRPDPALLRTLLARHQPQPGPAFEFAAIGDQHYGPDGERRWPALQQSINQSGVTFVVHTGDIKSGSTVCSNEMFDNRAASFNAFTMPMILTPGDNEWTDCHRENNGSFDPLERLRHLRRTFYPDNRSLGQRKIALSQQSEDARYTTYIENSMWSSGNVLFATLHVVGSNNNLGRNAENDREYEERQRANANWVRMIFSVARDAEFAGVVLVMQANPGFDGPRVPVERLGTGFREIFSQLEDEAIVYDRPILLIHGDSHEFHVDKPLTGARSGRVIENVLRLEVPGSADIHWVRVRVDPSRLGLFAVSHEDVVPNRAAQQRAVN